MARESSARRIRHSTTALRPGRLTLRRPRLLEFPTFSDARGNLTAVEAAHDIPFAVRRVYYLYDVPATALRGGHVHLVEEEVVIPMHGQFTLEIDDGFHREAVRLSGASRALYVPNLVWHELRDFTPDAVCLVLASEHYDPKDYCSVYEDFQRLVHDSALDEDWRE